MFAAFQSLCWSVGRQGTTDSRSGQVSRRRPGARARSRFAVEALESRWLLSTLGANADDPEPDQSLIVVAAVSQATTSSTADELSDKPDTSSSESSAEAAAATRFQWTWPDDWSTALDLPDATQVKVKGELSPGSLPHLLAIHLTPDTLTIHLEFKSAADDQPLVGTLQLFDSELNESVRFTPDFESRSFVVSVPVDFKSSSTLYLKISVPSTFAANSTSQSALEPETFAYDLDVTRETNDAGLGTVGSPSDPTGTDPGENWYEGGGGDGTGWGNGGGSGNGGVDGTSPAPGTDGLIIILPGPQAPAGPSFPTAPPPPASSGGSDSPDPGDPKPDGETVLVSVTIISGPLPTRSAAPLGGVLGSLDSTPPVDRHEGARADLAMFDPSRRLDDPDLDTRQVVVDGGPGPVDPGAEGTMVISLRGPGGLPLLATALVSGPASTDRNQDSASSEAGPANQAAAAMAPASLSVVYTQDRCSSLEQPTIAAAGSCSTSAGRSGSRRRASILPGLTLAFALGVSLVLPDLVAALQFITPARRLVRRRLIRRALTHG